MTTLLKNLKKNISEKLYDALASVLLKHDLLVFKNFCI
jgi:hypothetical protein